MPKTYLADKQTLDSVNNKVGTAGDAASATPGSLFAGIKQLISVLSNHVAVWTSARASKIDKLDLVQTTLNTPDGNTLAAWIKSISDSAGAANSNAANAANLASQANNNAWNACQEAINAKNAANNAANAASNVNFGSAIGIAQHGLYHSGELSGNGKGVLILNINQPFSLHIDNRDLGYFDVSTASANSMTFFFEFKNSYHVFGSGGAYANNYAVAVYY